MIRAQAAIVGAGPAGAAAARVLARRGVDVVLIEADDYAGPRIGESFPPAVGGLLARLGVDLSRLRLDGHGVRSVWGAPEPDVRSHVCEPGGIGWHVDRPAFDAALASAAVAAGARLMRERLVHCQRAAEGWRLTLSQGGSVKARLVLDASGRRAAFARRAGARRIRADGLVALAFQGFEAPLGAYGAYTLIEAAPDGWWYSAPIPGDRAVAVRFGRPDALRRPSSLPALTAARHCELELGLGRPHAAGASLLEPLCGPGWLAVGDAAMTMDPLSGDGVCRALDQGMRAVEAAIAALAGDASALQARAAGVRAAFDAYGRARAGFYAAERRWPETGFWRWARSLGGDAGPAVAAL